MVIPYFVGVCELTKREHKDWYPEIIRFAIANTATDQRLDIMAQRGGEINLNDTLSATTFL